MGSRLVVLVILALLQTGLACAKELPYNLVGRVVWVYDGDTIKMVDTERNYHRIRLASVDAPEKEQPYGPAAEALLKLLVYGKEVQARVKTVDKYGREVATVTCQGQDISHVLLQKGAAWHLSYFDKREPCFGKHKLLEQQARLHKIGLWADAAACPPWQWRKDQHPAEGGRK